MSNLSDIGFHIGNKEDFLVLVERVFEKSTPLETKKGTYFQFTDKSGAELWIQMNNKNELIGANPHFRGKSRRKVSITSTIDKPPSILDGSFYSWADPSEDDGPESGVYPFVFDVPNHKKFEGIEIPQILEIQLSAFAQHFEYYESEDAFATEQKGEAKWASQSFVPSGLFSPEGGEATNPPQALGIFAGLVKESEKRKNQFTGQEFYWMLVDTLGGEVDVLADLNFLENTVPKVGGVVHGTFWLSGALLNEPKMKKKNQGGFLSRLFGK